MRRLRVFDWLAAEDIVQPSDKKLCSVMQDKSLQDPRLFASVLPSLLLKVSRASLTEDFYLSDDR